MPPEPSSRASLITETITWLIGPARTTLTPAQIVEGVVERLLEAGVPLWRVRVGQSVANPLISAWGIIWTREGGIQPYQVERRVLSTGSYKGSPFEAVVNTRQTYRHSLIGLNPAKDHEVLLELAAAGGTDYFATPVAYSGGRMQVSAFTSDAPEGFRDEHIALIEQLNPAIASALEPAALRQSMDSLLEVYLGSGPARRIAAGDFLRGQTTELHAAIVVCDLRNFTGLSERLPPEDLLRQLGDYFEVIVDAMRAEGGDVLKFVGDGVLTVFAVENGDEADACRRAARAISKALIAAAEKDFNFVAAAHVGPVVYGNIGSPDRLDFTVVGSTVNFVSRLEGIAKQSGRRAVCSTEFAAALPAGEAIDLGLFAIKGFDEEQRVFGFDVG